MVIIRMKYIAVYLMAGLLFVLSSCTENKTNKKNTNRKDTSVSSDKDSIAPVPTPVSLVNYYKDDAYLSAKTDSILSSLSDKEKVGQMIIASYGELGRPKEQVSKLISERRIGGVVILKGSSGELKEQVNYLRKVSKSAGSLPLIFSCDAEPTLFNSKLRGSPQVINTSEIKSTKDCAKVSLTISEFIKNSGFNQNYAPVCDFDLNKDIIGNRSFGRETAEVSSLANEFIKVSQNSGIVATAKHFPGHGTVKGDSHNSIVYIDGELKELDVFKDVIKNGVISVMVGHIAVKNNKKYDTGGLPSTLSKIVVTDLLRNKLGFKGLIITDAMNMGALNGFSTPSLNAVKAGCDLILMPTNENALFESILELISNDAAYKMQINESVRRIIRLKICLGML
ncbi:MAG: glycoside hydrolase family 3 protein [Ignavibacteria bacterium]|nr:glycoside hydrolase family 3 protein [Ignavibacteria bacterium]